MQDDNHSIRKQTLILSVFAIVVLTILVGYSWYWNTDNIHNEKINLALTEARSNWNKDASFRRWAAQHGGLYVPPDERTPPNPALKHLANRDVETTDGQKLTLMNPAYMMRQMAEEFEEDFGVKGKITGKVQLNPINKPDEWQLKVLNIFESGKSDEVYEQQMIDGQPYLRYMKAMYMTEGCVKCHGILGFKDGDLRGGVSVSIPLARYFSAASETNDGIRFTHITVWLVGILAIFFFARLFARLLIRTTNEALHDSLTKLPNIRLFKNRLEQSFKKYQRDPSSLFAVCFLDLDRFKNLNDSRGHKVGDKLLVSLSSRLSKLLRPEDTLARMGGDEFTLLLSNINSVDEALNIAERFLLSFKEPFYIDNDEIYTDASIGICMVTEKYTDMEDMIRDADIAMYRAKTSGKGRVDVYNPEMHKYAMETMQIENDLRAAIQKDQMAVYYQPVINVTNGCIDGFEALLRWHHPKMGDVSPERFIPVAESSGQIKEIGKWVLEQACIQTREWSLQFCPEDEFIISVNLSGVQLTEQDIQETVSGVLNRCRFNPSKLHLEVTETALVGHKNRAKQAVNYIRELGVSVSIDDFGKGYCSLAYLQEFEFDTLKIDKDFVQDMGVDGKGLQLVRMLMLLARDLDMKVIAEGVETEEQFNRLSAMKCSHIQGYYFSRPVTAKHIKMMLDEGCHKDVNLLLKNNCSSQTTSKTG